MAGPAGDAQGPSRTGQDPQSPAPSPDPQSGDMTPDYGDHYSADQPWSWAQATSAPQPPNEPSAPVEGESYSPPVEGESYSPPVPATPPPGQSVAGTPRGRRQGRGAGRLEGCP